MAKVRRLPERQCVACGQVRAKRDLVRVVRTAAGDVRVDPTGKLSGRGAYVCPDASCIERAVHEGKLARMLEREIPAEVAQGLRGAPQRSATPRPPVLHRIPLAQAAELFGEKPSRKPGAP
ncbi:MAG TPA: YlxR family protein [bacterium]|nr:YlxR family protein [bacterium]